MVKAICGQILANKISEFSLNTGNRPRYGVARVTAYHLCTAVEPTGKWQEKNFSLKNRAAAKQDN